MLKTVSHTKITGRFSSAFQFFDIIRNIADCHKSLISFSGKTNV